MKPLISESLAHRNSAHLFGRSRDRSHSKQLKPDPQPDCEEDKTVSECADSAQEEEVEEEEYVPVIPAWTRCSPADLYFSRDVMVRHSKGPATRNDFFNDIVDDARADAIFATLKTIVDDGYSTISSTISLRVAGPLDLASFKVITENNHSKYL